MHRPSKQEQQHPHRVMKRAGLVFVPTPTVGHLVPTIEFSKHLLNLSDRFLVTILVMKSPFGVVAGQSNTSHSLPAASHPHIKLIHLPTVDPPVDSGSVEKFLGDYIEKHKNHVKDTILNQVLPVTSHIAGVIIDMFCTCSMIDVANDLKVPSFVFFTSGAGFLGLLLFLQKRYDQVGKVFGESDPDSTVPSYVNPIPTKVLPAFAFNNGGYVSFANHARRFKETKGIIINSLVELESHALHSLSHSFMGEVDQVQPHVYAVGPLVDIKSKYQVQSNPTKVDEIMKWLDEQPPKSVVFLCFGTFGSFEKTQLKEMAIGLEQSGQRFLWSVRQISPKRTMELHAPSEYTNYEDFLPDGFMERTKGIGMLCGWAPQVEVLSHIATGAFVSHCGWNSILESLWLGVPIVTWPLYAEQQINAFQMVRDLGLAVELRVSYKIDGSDFVTANEIEKVLRQVMGSDNDINTRVQQMSEICRKAVDDGGSSSISLRSLIEVLSKTLEC